MRNTLKEFDAYFDYFSKIATQESHKDSGHTWIAFTDKWNAFKKQLTPTTKIISGFPGVGKSKATGLFNDPCNGCFVNDSDSSKFSKDYFPENYLEHIYYQYHSAKPTVLFVSSHELVRKGLVNMRIPFYLVYPAKTQLGEYIQRFIDRGSPPAFVDLVYKNWNEWIDDCAKQPGCTKIELNPGQYLSDVLGELISEQNPEPSIATEDAQGENPNNQK